MITFAPRRQGAEKLDKIYRYVLSTDYRHYYRHLVRSPWQLVKDHGENAKLLLLSTAERPHPLRIHGEILEQLGGRQSILRSKSIIAEANLLFGDPKSGRPKARVASKNVGGTVRRLGMVLRQFDLTYDVENMPPNGLVDLLPKEFDKWKVKHPPDVRRTTNHIDLHRFQTTRSANVAPVQLGRTPS